MTPSLFPDINVWLALTHERHSHHEPAAKWFSSISSGTLYFTRFTQIGLLRLLTNDHVMQDDVMHQREAWRAYRKWFKDERIEFHREPDSPELERLFEKLSESNQLSTRLWADAYLAAFAGAAGLTLVTFDLALHRLKGVDVLTLS